MSGRRETLAQIPPPAKGSTLGGRLRTWFLTGIVVTGPLAVTVYIVWWFIDTIDSWVKKIVPVSFWPDAYLPIHVPGFGVIFALFGLTFLGFLAANLAGRSLISLGEAILGRMPVVRSIYSSVKQIFETLFAQSGTSFRKVGMIQFPAKGMWSLVFISSPPGESLVGSLPPSDTYISVFLPCTPNPTSGFYVFVPAHEVIEVSLTTEEAAKLIMSCGVIQPEGLAVDHAKHEKADAQSAV